MEIPYLHPKKILAISIVIQNQDEILYTVLETIRKKNNIDVVDIEKKYSSIDSLISDLSGKTPLVLNIDGKGVISKMKEDEGQSNIALIQQVLPNANETDFYIQKWKHSFSICRHETINKILLPFIENGIAVLDIHIGTQSILYILDLLREYEEVPFNNRAISLSNECINSIDKNVSDAASVKIDDHTFSHNTLPAFAISYAAQTKQFSDYSNKTFEKTRDHFYFISFVKQTWKYIVSFFLIVMIANAIIYSNLTNKVNSQQQYIKTNDHILQEVKTLKEDYEFKKNIVSDSRYNKQSRYSWHIDKIMKTMPKGIKLTYTYVNPPLEKLRTKEEFLTENIILVKGKSANSSSLSQWINILEDYDWIKKAELYTYHTTSSGVNTNREFELGITFSD